MNLPTAKLEQLRASVVPELSLCWDVDDEMPTGRALEFAYGRLIYALHEHDPQALSWLTFFVARRALSCWDANAAGPELAKRVEELRHFFEEGSEPDWETLCERVASPFVDCRFSDTQSAADAVAYCADYARSPRPLIAVYCVSSADVAYDHILAEHNFRRWLLDIALPHCFDKRDLPQELREAYRPRSGLQPEGLGRASG